MPEPEIPDWEKPIYVNGQKLRAQDVQHLADGIRLTLDLIQGERIRESVQLLVEEFTRTGHTVSGARVVGDDLYLDFGDNVTVNVGTVRGPSGGPGPRNVLTVGTVSILPPGAQATVTLQTGATGQVLSLGIPQGPQGEPGGRGEPGPKGDKGDVGPAGMTFRGNWSNLIDYAEDDAVVHLGATWFASVDPPSGAAPESGSPYWHAMALQGSKGDTGNPGPFTTISAGTVTTLAAGSSATVTLSGASGSRSLNLGIPRGDKGDIGDLTTQLNATLSGAVAAWPAGVGVPSTLLALLGGNVTLPALPAGPAGKAGTFTLILRQDAVGGFGVTTWPSNVKWPEENPPTVSIAANADTIIHFLWAGGRWTGALQGRYSA